MRLITSHKSRAITINLVLVKVGNGTVIVSLIQPMAERLVEKENVGLQVLGGYRVKEISLEKGKDSKSHASKLSYLNTHSGEIEEISNIDGIVLKQHNL